MRSIFKLTTEAILIYEMITNIHIKEMPSIECSVYVYTLQRHNDYGVNMISYNFA